MISYKFCKCGKKIPTHLRMCETCKSKSKKLLNQNYDKFKRDLKSKEFYNSTKWRKLRKTYISEHPFCNDEFRAYFTEASRWHDLSGIDVDRLNVAVFSRAAAEVVTEMKNEATAAGSEIEGDVIRAATEECILHGLEDLKRTLDGIDSLQGAGDITPEMRSAMKSAAYRYGPLDPGVLFAIAKEASKPAWTVGVKFLSAPCPTSTQLAEETSRLAAAFAGLRRSMGEDFAGSENLLGIAVMMASEMADLSALDMVHLLDNLESPEAQAVCGGFNFLKGESESEAGRMTASAAPALMNQLRMHAEHVVRGSSEDEPLYYGESADDLTGIPPGMMEEAQRLSGGVITPIDVELAQLDPPLAKEDWAQLRTFANSFQEAAAGSLLDFAIPKWIAPSAGKVLELVRSAPDGKPTMDKLWDLFTGGCAGRAPAVLRGSQDVHALLSAMNEAYAGLVKRAVPDAPDMMLDSALMNNSGRGVEVSTMFRLAKSGGRMTMADVKAGDAMALSSLRSYDASNAYGLCTDFRRRDAAATLTFVRADGAEMTLHPHFIEDADNTPANPELENIVGFWQSMSASDPQLRRIGQSFSQASLMAPRMMSALFPGAEYNEHGIFSMKAVQQPDGRVIVDVGNDPKSALVFREQIEILPDGTHRFTDFEMTRRSRFSRRG